MKRTKSVMKRTNNPCIYCIRKNLDTVNGAKICAMCQSGEYQYTMFRGLSLKELKDNREIPTGEGVDYG